MPGPEDSNTSGQSEHTSQHPLDEFTRARYRRLLDGKLQDARSRANEIREVGEMAATILSAHHTTPHQRIPETDQGGGDAWLVAGFRRNQTGRSPVRQYASRTEAAPAYQLTLYCLFAGRIGVDRTAGLVRLDDPEYHVQGREPSGIVDIRDLSALDRDVVFDEENAGYYWTPAGFREEEVVDDSPSSIQRIPSIRLGIENLLKQAGIV